MAEVSTPSVDKMSTNDTGETQLEKQQKAKPEKPDELKYKEDLAKAEKEHATAQANVVCRIQ